MLPQEMPGRFRGRGECRPVDVGTALRAPGVGRSGLSTCYRVAPAQGSWLGSTTEHGEASVSPRCARRLGQVSQPGSRLRRFPGLTGEDLRGYFFTVLVTESLMLSAIPATVPVASDTASLMPANT